MIYLEILGNEKFFNGNIDIVLDILIWIGIFKELIWEVIGCWIRLSIRN